MKITALAASALAAGAIGIVSAPIASADPDVTNLGSQAKLVDGTVVQGWTVANLKPSSDAIPYPVQGTLWEATANDQAIAGSVTPIVSNLNARARNGQTYRVLFGVATPQGVNPSTLAQGQQTTGKIYFDVTGEAPDSVVYNAGGPDLALWVQPPPSSPSSSGSGTGWSPSSVGSGTAAPAEATPAPGTPAAPAVAGAPAAPVPAGSSGTPLPAGSSGTPIVEGAPVTPAPGSTGTPVVEGAPVTPAPAAAPGSSGTPAVEGTTPTPAMAPAATGSTGTPVTGGAPVAPTTTVVPAPGA